MANHFQSKDESRLDGVLKFVLAVVKHWKVWATSSVIAAASWVVSNLGYHLPRWLFVTIAMIGWLIAFYQAWDAEHQRVLVLQRRLGGEEAERERESEKQKLIKATSMLRGMKDKVLDWRGFTNHMWGMAPPVSHLVPTADDFATILLLAEKIRPELRRELETAHSKVARAETLIDQFQHQPIAYRQEPLMAEAYKLLDEAAPLVDKAVAEFERYEQK